VNGLQKEQGGRNCVEEKEKTRELFNLKASNRSQPWFRGGEREQGGSLFLESKKKKRRAIRKEGKEKKRDNILTGVSHRYEPSPWEKETRPHILFKESAMGGKALSESE